MSAIEGSLTALEEKLGEWMTSIGDPDLLGTSAAMAMATLAAVVATCLYDYFYESRTTGSQIQRSFLLIGPSVTVTRRTLAFISG